MFQTTTGLHRVAFSRYCCPDVRLEIFGKFSVITIFPFFFCSEGIRFWGFSILLQCVFFSILHTNFCGSNETGTCSPLLPSFPSRGVIYAEQIALQRQPPPPEKHSRLAVFFLFAVDSSTFGVSIRFVLAHAGDGNRRPVECWRRDIAMMVSGRTTIATQIDGLLGKIFR